MLHTMNEKQAGEKAERHVRDVMSALPKQARLEPIYLPHTPCDDPSDNGPKGRVEANREYWIRDLPGDTNEHYFDALLDYWQGHNFRVLTDARPQDYFISVENKQDFFRMSVTGGPTGAMSIGASSPCVWPNGTPPPSATSGN